MGDDLQIEEPYRIPISELNLYILMYLCLLALISVLLAVYYNVFDSYSLVPYF